MTYFSQSLGFPRGVIIVGLALSLLVAACGTSSAKSSANTDGSSATTSNPADSSSAGCTATNNAVNGISTESFCGPAKGQATYQGQTYTWTQGACFNQPEGAGVNIGHEVLDPANTAAGKALKQQYDYFGVEAQATQDGTYDGVFAGYYHGIDMTASGSVIFSNNLQAGSFTGKVILNQAAVTASWTCA